MIACGWCGAPTPEGACASCGRDAALPYLQRAQEPLPAADPVVKRIADAKAAIVSDGQTPTVSRIAERLDVSERTVRRWLQVSG